MFYVLTLKLSFLYPSSMPWNLALCFCFILHTMEFSTILLCYLCLLKLGLHLPFRQIAFSDNHSDQTVPKESPGTMTALRIYWINCLTGFVSEFLKISEINDMLSVECLSLVIRHSYRPIMVPAGQTATTN